MRGVYESIDDVPEVLRDEYQFDEQLGRFVLKLEEHPVLSALDGAKSKIDEFRGNNVKLMKEREDALNRLKAYGDVTPETVAQLRSKVSEFEKNTGASDPKSVAILIAQQVEQHVGPLREQLQKERESREAKERALARKNVETALRDAAVKAGVADPALPDFLNRGLSVFVYEGDDVIAKDKDGQPVYSQHRPGQALSPEEWAFGLAETAPHLFRESNGGGAPGGSGSAEGGRGRERWVDGTSPVEIGRNLEDVASGRVRVAIPR